MNSLSKTREIQKEQIESMFYWIEDDIQHFRFAFLAHYQVLNQIIQLAVDAMNDEMPRLAYFYFTEYMASIYAETCITVECLLKSLLEDEKVEQRVIRGFNHNICALLDEVKKHDTKRLLEIVSIIETNRNSLEQLSKDSAFVRARYMELSDAYMSDYFLSIWEIIRSLDTIACNYYRADDLINVVYPDTMAG